MSIGSEIIPEYKRLLKEARDLLVLCSLIDKSGQCNEMVDKIDMFANKNKN